MKGKILFYALAIGILFLSACGSEDKVAISEKDMNCKSCIFMLHNTGAGYELKRIDVIHTEEELDDATTPGQYFTLRFHPEDAITKEIWLALWGPKVLDSRSSPADNDFVHITKSPPSLKSPKDADHQDIAIGYLDQVPLSPVPNDSAQ